MGRNGETALPRRGEQDPPGPEAERAAGGDLPLSAAGGFGGAAGEDIVSGVIRLFSRIVTLPLIGLGASARGLAEVIEEIERMAGPRVPEPVQPAPSKVVEGVVQDPQRER